MHNIFLLVHLGSNCYLYWPYFKKLFLNAFIRCIAIGSFRNYVVHERDYVNTCSQYCTRMDIAIFIFGTTSPPVKLNIIYWMKYNIIAKHDWTNNITFFIIGTENDLFINTYLHSRVGKVTQPNKNRNIF